MAIIACNCNCTSIAISDLISTVLQMQNYKNCVFVQQIIDLTADKTAEF